MVNMWSYLFFSYKLYYYTDEHENFCIVGVNDIDSGNDEGAKVSPHR